MRIRENRKILFIVPALFFYVLAVLAGQSLGRQSQVIHAALVSHFPDSAEVGAVWEAEKEQEKPRSFCFFSMIGIETYRNEDNGRSTKAQSVCCAGDTRYYQWQAAGLDLGDKEGCLIDKQTAWELFGTEDAAGQELTREITKGKKTETQTYRIRKILNTKEQTVIFQDGRKETEFNMVNIYLPASEVPSDYMETFLNAYGLSGVLAETGWYASLGEAVLLIVPVYLGIRILQYQKREWKEQKYRRLFVLLGAGILGICIFLFFQTVSIPGDWIPTKWSDFEFFRNKFQELQDGFRLYLQFPKSSEEIQRLGECLKTLIYSGLSIFLLKMTVNLSKK